MNVEQSIKAALATESLTTPELEARLGLQEYEARRQMRRILSNMLGRGVVEREDQEPQYHLTGRGREALQRKIWRALQIRGACTPKQAALLVECSQDYSRRYLYWLGKQGWVLRDADSAICRVNPEKSGQAPPHWNRTQDEGRTR